MWEKIKTWITEHKGLAAVLAGLLVAGLYYIFRRSKSGQGSESYSPAMMSYSPGDGGSSGGSSGGGSSGGSDIAGLAGLIQQGQKDQLEQQQNFFDAMSDYFKDATAQMAESIKNATTVIQTPTITMPDVPWSNLKVEEQQDVFNLMQQPDVNVDTGARYIQNKIIWNEELKKIGADPSDENTWSLPMIIANRANDAIRKIAGYDDKGANDSIQDQNAWGLGKGAAKQGSALEKYNENRLNTDPAFLASEKQRTAQVIANRKKAGLDTSVQEAYQKRLETGSY